MMDRTKGIGGTDAPAIVGLNPWKAPIDVYMEKLGLVEPMADNDNLWWGREMQPILKKRYEQETGLTVSEEVSLCHPDYSWYVGTPDGLIYDSNGNVWAGVDYKTTGTAKIDDWGEPGTDAVPEFYHLQAMWYMGLTGAQWWDIAVLFMGARREFRIYKINRDDELICTLTDKCRDFWNNHVLPKIPPPIDSATGWKEYFKAKFPAEKEDLIELNDEVIGNYKMLCEQVKIDIAAKDEFENRVKSILGDHAGLTSPWGKITWKKSKDRTVVDWESAFNYLADLADYADTSILLKMFTTTKPGPRVFRCAWNKEK